MDLVQIKVALRQGDPNGIRTAQVTRVTDLAIAFKRNQLGDVLNEFPSIKEQSGVYLLIGSEEQPMKVYIGETDSLGQRLQEHQKDQNKDFWIDTVILTSSGEHLTKGQVMYVESRLLHTKYDQSRWKIINTQTPSKDAGKLPRDTQAVMNEFIESSKVLVGTLGWDIFREPLNDSRETSTLSPQKEGQQREFSYKKEGKFDAKMIVALTGECIVLKGSKARKDPSMSGEGYVKTKRSDLIKNKVLVDEGEYYVFTHDCPFNSPSAAASMIYGSNSNGRTNWKLSDGRTYKEWEDSKNG